MSLQDWTDHPGRETALSPAPRAYLQRLSLRLFKLFGLWIERRIQRRDLAALDDRLLKDVGISRSEARQETGKPFWR